jgi:hypothetical protein
MTARIMMLFFVLLFSRAAHPFLEYIVLHFPAYQFCTLSQQLKKLATLSDNIPTEKSYGINEKKQILQQLLQYQQLQAMPG